jgi:hypothetical protein
VVKESLRDQLLLSTADAPLVVVELECLQYFLVKCMIAEKGWVGGKANRLGNVEMYIYRRSGLLNRNGGNHNGDIGQEGALAAYKHAG